MATQGKVEYGAISFVSFFVFLIYNAVICIDGAIRSDMPSVVMIKYLYKTTIYFFLNLRSRPINFIRIFLTIVAKLIKGAANAFIKAIVPQIKN